MGKIEIELSPEQRYELIKQMDNYEIASFVLERFDKKCLEILASDLSNIKKALMIKIHTDDFYKDNIEKLENYINSSSEEEVKNFDIYVLRLHNLNVN